MPRNASGTYTLPSGNPVVAGTTIEASWANTTLNDVANELTNSLSRTGSGGMLAPFRLADGTLGAPGIAFLNETSSGLYRPSAGLPTPTSASSAATKAYVDTALAAVTTSSTRQTYTATASQTTFSITYNVGSIDVYRNGVKQINGTDFTATNGTSVVFASGLPAGDIVDMVAYGAVGGGTSLQVISGNTAAVSGCLYVMTASLTLTLPASPAVGDTVRVSNLSGTTTCVVGRNGNKIQNVAEDLTIDSLNAAITLTYASASLGWVFA